MQERIRKVMEHYGLTQQEFAAKLGLSAATISSIFTGRTKPTNNHVQAIHRQFPEINTNWLLFGEGEMIDLDRVAASSGAGRQQASSADKAADPRSVFPGAQGQEPLPLFAEESQDSASFTRPNDSGPIPATHSSHAGMQSTHRQQPMTSTSRKAEVDPYLQIANRIDNQARRIKEIRVFYDDGTFEVFAPSGR